jgi:hypothetical protein
VAHARLCQTQVGVPLLKLNAAQLAFSGRNLAIRAGG